MDNQELVREQYGSSPLQERIDDALRQAGLNEGKLDWSSLAGLDQFHVRGLGATKELAEALKIEPASEILDVGCGLGGPARFLAATYRCQVTGIDLSQPYVDVANSLTERCGLQDHAKFVRADALNLPFAESRFDHAWTQHVAMNISDRARFYSEIHRVLKTGGRLAIYDVIAGDGRPLNFPVPWARRPEMSFLLTADAMRKVLRETGFTELSWSDTTAASITWFAELQTRLRSAPPLALPVVMGPQFPEMTENLARNLKEGRARVVQSIWAWAQVGS
jgi:SAM-dependent methyltransferase